MARRFVSLDLLGIPFPALGAWLLAPVLAGCLGGELDTSTVPSVQTDTSTSVKPPPKDTTPAQGGIAAVHSIYPRLKLGEKWVYSQYSGTDTGTVYSAEVVGESTFGNDSVYVERISVTASPFVVDQFGTLVKNYVQTGLVFARKSDQETVHDSLSKNLDLWYSGDTVGIHYHEDYVSVTRITGSLPDSLAAGAAWKLASVHSKTTRWSYTDTAGIDTSTDTGSRTYLVKPSATVSVKAGTYPAFEIDEADSGSTATTQVWFAPSAKAIVREIDTYTDHADTTELSALELK